MPNLLSAIDKYPAHHHHFVMGKFLLIISMLVGSAFGAHAEEFTLTTSYYSAWRNAGQELEIISNPEDDWAYWSNDNQNTSVRCGVVTRKKYTAVYNCEGKALRLRYDKKSGALYINDFRFERFK